MKTSLAAALALLALAAPATAAEPVKVADAADLFPPDTIAYAEVVKPAELAKTVAAFTTGTIIDDMMPFMAKWREKHGDGFFPAREMIGVFSAFAAPEALAEFSRMQGAAVAFTGMTKEGDPDITGIILAGESNVPGFFLRVILTAEGSMNKAGEVEGVVIYGCRSRVFRAVGPGGAPAAPAPPLESPFIANLPGVIVIGSSLPTVSDVVKRIKGKEKRLALSGEAGFKAAAKERARPGLFVYANPARALELVYKTFEEGFDFEAELRAAEKVFNLAAIRSVAANLALVDGSPDLRVAIRVDAGKSSPLLDLFAQKKVTSQALQGAPKDTVASFTLGIADGEKQLAKLLAAADAAVGDHGPKPSDSVKELETKLKLAFGKDVLGKLASITVALPGKQELPKGAVEVPMLLLAGVDVAAAEKLEQLIAPLIGALMGEDVQPVTETIQGVKVRSLPGSKLPWKAALHYGRRGETLVLGADRKLVAAALLAKPGDGPAAHAAIAAALAEHDGAAALGLWRWSTMLPEALAAFSNQPRWANGQQVQPQPSELRERVEKLRKQHAALIDQLPPLVVSLAQEDGATVVRLRQRTPAESRSKIIESVLDAIMGGATNIFDNAQFAPAAPPPPVKN